MQLGVLDRQLDECRVLPKPHLAGDIAGTRCAAGDGIGQGKFRRRTGINRMPARRPLLGTGELPQVVDHIGNIAGQASAGMAPQFLTRRVLSDRDGAEEFHWDPLHARVICGHKGRVQETRASALACCSRLSTRTLHISCPCARIASASHSALFIMRYCLILSMRLFW